ncbi:MAG: methyltransferase domain-containing protein [Nitrosopumilus sp.]
MLIFLLIFFHYWVVLNHLHSFEFVLKISILIRIANCDDIFLLKKFDIVIFTEVLEHFNFHPVMILKKIHSLLKSPDKLYLSTPDSHEWGKITKYYKKI